VFDELFLYLCIYKNSEEVAFYQGNRKEQAIVNSTLHRLVLLLLLLFIIYLHT